MIRRRNEKIFVHSCCGPCSTAVSERLAADFSVTLFFYNPNITDESEYLRRLESQRRFVEGYNRYNLSVNAKQSVQTGQAEQIRLIVGPYEPSLFLERVSGLEDTPEGGARCERCFALRLEKTAEAARADGTEEFTTTLSISPHKNHALITRIGEETALHYGLRFRADDFKKQDGYRRSVALAKTYELYRQNYCGCVFSKVEQEARSHAGHNGKADAYPKGDPEYPATARRKEVFETQNMENE